MLKARLLAFDLFVILMKSSSRENII